jgi:hypothetical protein
LLKVTALVITYSGAPDLYADRLAVAPVSYFFENRAATATSIKGNYHA